MAVLAGVYGIANSIDMPARQAYVVELTGKDDLMNAIALNSAVFNSARVVGPALAGIAHRQRTASATAFFINGVSFLAVLAALARHAHRRRAASGRARHRARGARAERALRRAHAARSCSCSACCSS